MATNIRLQQISIAALSSLLTKQIGVQSGTDADLSFRMWGGKDASGDVVQFLAKDKPARVTEMEATGDYVVGATKALYFGGKTTDGSWRIIRDGNNLAVQRRESGSWVEKLLVEA
jgi:hypothetical protein